MIRIKHFYGREVYVCKRINVFGKGELPAGTHTYAFRVPLPEKCPTSCEGSYGRIAYEVLLVVDRSWRFNNEYKKTVTVLQTYNLNMYPELRVPLKSEDIKYFCCWPCSSGPVISTLTMPFGGYAPGQRIHYVLHIDNQSRGYDLTGIEVSLVQLKVFTATTPHHESRSSTSTYCTTYQAELVRRLSKRIINGSLVIPSVPPSSRNQRAIRLISSAQSFTWDSIGSFHCTWRK
ncbi:hypothetical protein AWZ03_005598 [Drosophila navojoa]|uniref:Arrestin C-terminal-like domain-containing protein n=1 Tax=Drosophila navojoa TaxID=7232 RepID=A0A484BIU6_DRONA|nr:hypothetical protein AWZ03_005598 [Drosophila navojoa]